MSYLVIGITPAFFYFNTISPINCSFFINPRFSFKIVWSSFDKVFSWIKSFIKSSRMSKVLLFLISFL